MAVFTLVTSQCIERLSWCLIQLLAYYYLCSVFKLRYPISSGYLSILCLIELKRLLENTMKALQSLILTIYSKSEYVIYKLKEMGKVTDKDIMLICKTFDRLDAGNCGKITLADLMESHH
ncbi:hypothetical protein Acr_06g0006380 [Actinidia rufa]|uniref:Uncharacterized protein n=1 Tax=Actinidia rufa TaxID=165716 RepID=A0A7J0EQE0_9ERIC|nr:hypothetical protein Acr_06g0006380 [Actinidia rufa]